MTFKFLNYPIVLIVLYISFTNTYFLSEIKAQNCTYDVNLIDPSTGATVKRTTDLAIGKINRQPFYIKAQCIGNNKYLKIRYYCYDDFYISDKECMKFTFVDGTCVELTPRPIDGESESVNISKISTMLIYPVNDRQLNQIIAQPIERIDIQTIQGDIEGFEIKERQQTVIKQMLDCVTI